jgi:hypothetical protein
MVKICSKCQKVFENVSLIYTNKGKKRYQCADGTFFKGKNCANCAKEAHKEYQRKKYGKTGGIKSLYCPQCGQNFKQDHVLQKYCSKSCKTSAYKDRKNVRDS